MITSDYQALSNYLQLINFAGFSPVGLSDY